nr:hypothetical protein [Desulfobacterales bacterium]
NKGSAKISLALKSIEKEKEDKAEQEEIEHKPATKVWQTTNGKICAESKIDELLAKLSNLECEQYIKNKNKDDFKDPVFMIELKGINKNKLLIFSMQGKDATEYPCISSANKYPFFLTKYQAEKIMIDPEKIVEKIVEKAVEK